MNNILEAIGRVVEYNLVSPSSYEQAHQRLSELDAAWRYIHDANTEMGECMIALVAEMTEGNDVFAEYFESPAPIQ